MIAPLAPDYREAVLWQEQVAPVAGGPAPPAPAEADVVVGAGYAGLSAARELGVAGRSVLVVDAHPVGWGASTRNGGMVIPELKAGPAAMARAYGPLGGRMYAEVNEAFDHVEALAAGPDPEIPCDYARTGQLYLAHAARLVPGLEAAARDHAERGEPVASCRGTPWPPRSARRRTTGRWSTSARAASTPPGSTPAWSGGPSPPG
jgi:glycine/D-amino acid oxidase-like deaminating enzyme